MSQESTNHCCFELRGWSELEEGMVVFARVSLPHDQDQGNRFPRHIRQDILQDPRDAIMLPKARPVVIVKIVRSIGNSSAHEHAICWPVTSLWKTMKKEDFDKACASNGRPPQAYYPIGKVESSEDWPYPPIEPAAPNKLAGFVDLWTPIAISWNNLIGLGKGSTSITPTALQLLQDAAPDFYHNPQLPFDNSSKNSSDGQSSPSPVVIHGATLSFAEYNAAQEIAKAMDLACDLKHRMLERSVTGKEMLWDLGGVIDVLRQLQLKAPTVTVPGSPATNSTALRPKPPRQRVYCNDSPTHHAPPREGGQGGGGSGGGGRSGSESRNDNRFQVATSRHGNWRRRQSNSVSNSSNTGNTGNQCTWNPDCTIGFGDGYFTSRLDLYDSREYDACSYASGWWCQDEWASEPEPESSPALRSIDTPAGFIPDEVPEIPEWVMDTKDTADDYSPAERDQYWKNEFRTVSVVAVWISRLMARTRRNSIANKAVYTDEDEERDIKEDAGENSAGKEGATDFASNTESEEQQDKDGSTTGSQISGSVDETTESENDEATPPDPTAEWSEQTASTVAVVESEELVCQTTEEQHSPSLTESQYFSDVSAEDLEESASAASSTAKTPNLDASRLFAVESEWGNPRSPTSTQGWSIQVASPTPTIASVPEEPLSHTTAEARFEDVIFLEDGTDECSSSASNFEPLESLPKDKDDSTITIRALLDPYDPDVAQVYNQNASPMLTPRNLSQLARILTSPPPASPVLTPQAQSLTRHSLTSSAHLPLDEKIEPQYICCGCKRRRERTYARFGASTRSEVLMRPLVKIGRPKWTRPKCISEPAWEATGALGFSGARWKFGVARVWDSAGIVQILWPVVHGGKTFL